MIRQSSRFKVFCVLIVVFSSCWLSAVARADASEPLFRAQFHDRLAPYGQWHQNDHLGWVWHPTDVDVGWRPYTRGHWILTDDQGWYWDSDFDWGWGWATFHYGNSRNADRMSNNPRKSNHIVNALPAKKRIV